MVFALFALIALSSFAANPDGDLRIEVDAAYNFVVDSNVETPATYAPSSAYLSATYHNDGTNALTDVWAYIGDYTNNTPGIYPSRTHTNLTGTFSLTHEGGSLGTADASRYLGTIEPGESVAVYWLVSYPNLDDAGNSVTGGQGPEDDLWLNYSMWGTAMDGVTALEADVPRKATMRSEISAAANKIFPNGANKVPDFYKNLLSAYEPSWTNSYDDGTPGTYIKTEGIWYDLGNVGAGFDNDDPPDLVPDRNAWLQPVGDPDIFDPSCFRLVKTYAFVVVKLNDGTEEIYDVEDQLYFENIPENNRGAVGYVRYDFLALRSGCSSQLTPYQEVASGLDNEKFNGDYGALLGEGLSSGTSKVEIVKSADPVITAADSNVTYTVAFTNAGAVSVGQPDMLLPLTVQDSVPADTVYVAGSAAVSNVLPSGVTSYTVYYSTNSGTSWTPTEPVPASDVTDLQWWLSDTLTPGEAGVVTFEVTVDNPAPPLIYNVAGLSFGNTATFAEDDATSLVAGTNGISGVVFKDTGEGTGGNYGNGQQDGTEPGISNVTVSLYYDSNGNGVYDDGDILFDSGGSATNGAYSFTNVPNGNFVVVVDDEDPDVPTGHTLTTLSEIPVVINDADSTGNDFGFAPGLGLTKTGPSLVEKGNQAVYTITVTNLTLGTAPQPTVVYTNWASVLTSSDSGWTSPSNTLGSPDAANGLLTIADRVDMLDVTGFGPNRGGTVTNVKIVVRGYHGAVAKASDEFRINLWTNGAAVADEIQLYTADTLPATSSNLVFDVTTNFTSLTWSDLTNATVQLVGQKNGGPGGSLINIDAIGLIVSYAGEAGVLETIPLQDFYDTNVLQFVSATPSVTTSDFTGPSPNTGRLYWDNVGPLGPADGTNLTVTFDVIGPEGNAGTITTNAVLITNATYNTGALANEAYDEAETEVPATGSIGDSVFWDANQNAAQDLAETGVPGVTVELYVDVDSNGVYSVGDTLVTNTVTDADGLYVFEGLPPDLYVVSVVTNSGPLAGVTQSSDPDGDGVPFALCDSQYGLELTSGQSFTGADFGYVPTGVIGDQLWVDTNTNGVQDAGESSIPYISVVLYSNGTAVVTNETDADGYYYFSGLNDGTTWQVTVVTNDTDFPAALIPVYDADGVLDSSTTNIVISGGTITSIDGTSVTNADLTVDFGYRYAGNNSLSGTVGFDAQPYDGVLNGTNTSGVASNEVAYVNVEVYAYLWDDDGDGIVEAGEYISIASATTDANGDYSFIGLPDGDGTNDQYIVSSAAPDDYLKITTTNGFIPGVTVVETTDAQGNTDSAYLTVPVATDITNMDFAYRSTRNYDYGDLPDSYQTLLPDGARHILALTTNLYLGTSVSADDNGQPSAAADLDTFDDGVALQGIWQHGTDGGSVQIEVGSGSGYLVGFVDFDQNGDMGSTGDLMISQSVTAGTYAISFDVPASTLSETETTSLYGRFRLLPTEPTFPQLAFQGTADDGEVEDYKWDFHVITGSVYVDDDSDTLFSSNDTVQAGVIIKLYDAASNLVAETVTDLDGEYSFYGLPDGDYRIEMETPTGATAILDVDGSGNGNSTIELTLSGSGADTQDFLLNTSASTAGFSGTVYEDDGFGTPGNDIFDSDALVPGVPVELYSDLNTNGIAEPNEWIGVVATASDGTYSFTDLPDGDYILLMTTPEGATSETDSDGISNGTNLIEASLSGTDVTGLDFLIDGLAALAEIGGRVWFDENDDGLQDAGDTNNIANLQVLLVNTNGVTIATTSTDSNGVYRFENVIPDTYLASFNLMDVSAALKVVTANVGTNDTIDSDGITGGTESMVDTADYTLMAGQTNMTVDLGITYLEATRAEVAEVRGEWRADGGYVIWETASEWNTAGFFAYFVDPETGEEAPLNTALTASAFFDSGSTYELAVPQAIEQGTATVRLEEIELTGATRDLGTHDIVFAEPPPVVLAPLALTAPMALASELPPEPSSVLKVLVRDEGIYGVSLQTIADGMGRSFSDIQMLAFDDLLRVTCQGEPVAVYFDALRDRILFYGESTDNWYARDAAYLISEGAALTMTQRTADASAGETIFSVQLRVEEDHYPFDSALSRPDDFYYWNYVISGHPSLGQRDYPLDLTGYASGDVELTVCLRGWSNTDMNPDHQADFLVNGVEAGSVQFDGQEVVQATLTVPANLVLNGTNTLTVKGVLQTGHSHSFFVTDWIDASFTRELVPQDGTALFSAGNASAVSAAAFTEPLVIALDETGTPTWIADESGGLPSKAWGTVSADEQFAVIDAEDVPMLGTSPAAADAWFLSETNRIDYLIVTSEELESAAQELADYRSGQGLRTGVAVFEEVCDLISYGLRTPEAIPELLKYANTNWEQAPWMVVLAGNGHYDYLGAINNEANHIPPMLLDTSDGLFAADGLLTDLDGDRLPDLAIGRLPALTAADLTAMIDKIKTYEAGFGSVAANQLVFAADSADGAGDFADANLQLAAAAAGTYPVEQIDLDTVEIADARAQLISRFNNGAGFIHYTGHGGVNNLSSQNLLSSSDVSGLNSSDMPPVVVALSCLVGRYEAPGVSGMGETLMRQPGGGAVSVWGPSGLSRNAPAVELGDAFYQTILQEGCGTLGLAILRARNSVQSDLFSRDTFAIYNLLGDPALRVAGQTGGQPQDSSFAQWRWQEFTPAELTDESASAGEDVFFEYVCGEDGLPRLNLRNNRLLWEQNQFRSDLEYRILVSTDLVSWTPVSSGVEILSEQLDAEGIMKQITAELEFAETQLFMKLEVIQK